VDLPTYTSIWRIEKRLYKLYDFRLPMPLPVGQITVFAAIAIPYVLLLTLLGLPLSHTLIWLYVLPPGVATWLVTRPVLEGKRLPELIGSQVRYYLAEPRVWCRMAAWSESDVTVVSAKVWRLSPEVLARLSDQIASRRASRAGSAAVVVAGLRRPILRRSAESRPGAAPTLPGTVAAASVASAPPAAAQSTATASAGQVTARTGTPTAARATAVTGMTGSGLRVRGLGLAAPRSRPASTASPTPPERKPHTPERHTPERHTPEPQPSAETRPGRLTADRPPAPAMPPLAPSAQAPSALALPAQAARPGQQPASTASPPVPAGPVPAQTSPPASVPPGPSPAVTVVGTAAAPAAPLPVERALAGPAGRRSDGRTGRVTVVPGGHRPGKPDQLQRDRARAQHPLDRHRSVVVLGCTVGAGQTITTLMTGEVLAGLRTEPVAVLDLNPSQESLSVRALLRPAPGQAASLATSRLAVLSAEPDSEGTIDPAQAGATLERAKAAHQIVIADPSTVAVPRLLAVADQLILVAPASSAASHAISMTFEWLDAHGEASLAAGAIMVMNGVSRQSTAHVEQAERVCIGRCRAIVRVPWDDQLKTHSAAKLPVATAGEPSAPSWAGVLSQPTVSAYTALAGVLVAALAGPDAGQAENQAGDPAPTRRAGR